MTLFTTFRSPRQLCYAIKPVVETAFGPVTARPWNMHEPDTTAWWLVPSTEWPAYKHGKFYFDWGKGRESILSGLYVEKGLGVSVRPAYSSRRGLCHIMQNDWAWFQLVRDFKTGKATEVISSLARKLPGSLLILIDGGYVSDPADSDRFKSSYDWFYHTFELNPWDLSLHIRGEQSPTGPFKILSQLRALTDIAPILQELTRQEWLWVDFFMALQAEVAAATPRGGNAVTWDETDLWGQFLQFLTPWIV